MLDLGREVGEGGRARAVLGGQARGRGRGERLTTTTSVAPRRTRVAVASAAIEPAPITTVRPEMSSSRCPETWPTRSRAAATSVGAAWSMPVSAWTRLPTRSACWNSTLRAGPTVPGLLATSQRVTGLAEDLGLADGHRVEPGGDLEEVGHRAVVVVDVEVGQEVLGGASRALDEQPGQLLDAAVEAVDVGVDLQAVAGGDDGGLRHVLAGGHVARELGGALAVDGDALQQRHGCGPVGDADHEHAHAVTPRLSTWAPTLALRCSW